MADPFIGGVIISVILIFGIIVSFYTVEKVGRRTSVLWAGVAMAVIDIAIGKQKSILSLCPQLTPSGGLGFKAPDAATGAGLITLCAIWVFIYSLSLAPIGWTSLVEVSSPRLRAKTAAIATVIQSLSNILFVSVWIQDCISI